MEGLFLVWVTLVGIVFSEITFFFLIFQRIQRAEAESKLFREAAEKNLEAQIGALDRAIGEVARIQGPDVEKVVEERMGGMKREFQALGLHVEDAYEKIRKAIGRFDQRERRSREREEVDQEETTQTQGVPEPPQPRELSRAELRAEGVRLARERGFRI